METLEEKYKNNSDLINCLDAVELLKEITLLYLLFLKDEEIETVKDIKNISLNYSELGLVGITMYTINSKSIPDFLEMEAGYGQLYPMIKKEDYIKALNNLACSE